MSNHDNRFKSSKPPEPIQPALTVDLTLEQLEKVRDIVKFHLDLEINLKLRELALIRSEIKKGEDFHLNFQQKKDLQSSSLDYLSGTRQSQRLSVYSSTRNHLTSELLSKQLLYARRTDGVYVSIHCPQCDRTKFGSQQGFLNHCRITHSLEFASHDEAINLCGTIVDSTEVPMDHPCRQRPITITKIVSSSVDPMTVFTDDTQSLDDTTSSNNKPYISSILTTDTHSEILTSLDTLPYKNATSNLGLLPLSQRTPITRPMVDISESRYHTRCRLIIGNVSQYLPTQPVSSTPVLESISDISPPLSSVVEESCPPDSHRWMVYVRAPSWSPQSEQFIECVRFYLHQSYAPHNIIDVHTPPFNITRTGWGEFTVRIRVYLIDSQRNKSLDYYHPLKLDKQLSGQQVLGGEEEFDVEIDKDTDLSCRTRAASSDEDDKLKINNRIPKISPEPMQVDIKSESTFIDQQLITSLTQFSTKHDITYDHLVSLHKLISLYPLPTITSSSPARQRAIEWQRAVSLREALDKSQPSRQIPLPTIFAVVRWCRAVESPHCLLCGRACHIQQNDCRFANYKLQLTSSVFDSFIEAQTALPAVHSTMISSENAINYIQTLTNMIGITGTDITSEELPPGVYLSEADATVLEEASCLFLFATLRVFLSRLLQDSVRIARGGTDTSSDIATLTPWHIFACLIDNKTSTKKKIYGFLAYTAPEGT